MDHQAIGPVLEVWKHPPGRGRALSVSVKVMVPRRPRPPAWAKQIASGALGGLPLSLAEVVGSSGNGSVGSGG